MIGLVFRAFMPRSGRRRHISTDEWVGAGYGAVYLIGFMVFVGVFGPGSFLIYLFFIGPLVFPAIWFLERKLSGRPVTAYRLLEDRRTTIYYTAAISVAILAVIAVVVVLNAAGLG